MKFTVFDLQFTILDYLGLGVGGLATASRRQLAG